MLNSLNIEHGMIKVIEYIKTNFPNMYSKHEKKVTWEKPRKGLSLLQILTKGETKGDEIHRVHLQETNQMPPPHRNKKF